MLNRRMGRLVASLSDTPSRRWAALKLSTAEKLLLNDSSDGTLNGEHWLQSRLATLRPAVVLDVGANRGEWTGAALELMPTAHVHAFEPIPEVSRDLRRDYSDHPRVTLNEVALTASGASMLTMWSSGRGDRMSSAVPSAWTDVHALSVTSDSGDHYLEAQGIDHVDLLKVDVEGHEMSVLTGVELSLARSRIDVVQFEFTLWAAVARTWLADYYELFEPQGFAVGKLMPRRVTWKAYAPEDERFFRCNYVAVRRGTRAAELLGAD